MHNTSMMGAASKLTGTKSNDIKANKIQRYKLSHYVTPECPLPNKQHTPSMTKLIRYVGSMFNITPFPQILGLSKKH